MNVLDGFNNSGVIEAIGGDADTHRRLVDMGLLGAEYSVKARRKNAALIDFGDFSAVVGRSTLECLKTVGKEK